MQQFEYEIEGPCINKRLDVFLSEANSEFSRSFLQSLIQSKYVFVNGKVVKPNYKTKNGDYVELKIPDPEPIEVEAEPIPLTVIYEDAALLVIDKPPGMVIHPSPGHARGTLVNALINHCSDLAGIGGVERPGVVHRLDKETSGLVVVAKTNKALLSLAAQFEERTVTKHYLALVSGNVQSNDGVMDLPIGRHKVYRKKMAFNEKGRKAITEFQVIDRFEGFSYLNLFPKTGRTHQIRVHLSFLGHPILGDKLYGGIKKRVSNLPVFVRQALHAFKLEFNHPINGQRFALKSSIPDDFQTALNFGQKIKP